MRNENPYRNFWVLREVGKCVEFGKRKRAQSEKEKNKCSVDGFDQIERELKSATDSK